MKKGGEHWNYKQQINIRKGNDYYYCTNVYEKIKDFGNAFGQAHRACKKIFDLRYTKTKEKHGEKGSKVDFNLDKELWKQSSRGVL